jgi:hypothetical protein
MKTIKLSQICRMCILAVLTTLSSFAMQSQTQISCPYPVSNVSLIPACNIEIRYEWHHYNGSGCYCPQNCGPMNQMITGGTAPNLIPAACCSGAVDVSVCVWDPTAGGGAGACISSIINMGCTNTPNSTTFVDCNGNTSNISVSSNGIIIW